MNSDGLGSDCTTFVSSIVVVPNRGSELRICTGTFRSFEIHTVRDT